MAPNVVFSPDMVVTELDQLGSNGIESMGLGMSTCMFGWQWLAIQVPRCPMHSTTIPNRFYTVNDEIQGTLGSIAEGVLLIVIRTSERSH